MALAGLGEPRCRGAPRHCRDVGILRMPLCWGPQLAPPSQQTTEPREAPVSPGCPPKEEDSRPDTSQISRSALPEITQEGASWLWIIRGAEASQGGGCGTRLRTERALQCPGDPTPATLTVGFQRHMLVGG